MHALTSAVACNVSEGLSEAALCKSCGKYTSKRSRRTHVTSEGHETEQATDLDGIIFLEAVLYGPFDKARAYFCSVNTYTHSA